jgi:hypothetical protein
MTSNEMAPRTGIDGSDSAEHPLYYALGPARR